MIQYLEVDLRAIETIKSYGINRIINEKSSKSLKKLKIENCKRDFLSEWKQPFENVKSLSFTVVDGKANENDVKMGQFFPAVVDLTLSNMKLDDWSFIDDQFSRNLTRLIVDDEIQNTKQSTDCIGNFFKNNSQISNVRVFGPSPNFLENIKFLKNVEVFDMRAKTPTKWLESESVIHIDNVKTVLFEISDDTPMLELLIFENLRVLFLNIKYTNERDSFKWRIFIKNQLSVNLEELYLSVNTAVLKRDFLTISEKWPNLKEATIESGYRNKADEIIEFITNSTQMESLKVTPGMDSLDVNNLKDKLNDEWDIQSLRDSTKFFKKYGNSGKLFFY